MSEQQKLQPGYYNGILLDSALSTTQKGDTKISLYFKINENGATKIWNGYLHGGSIDITIKALCLCGLKGTDLVPLAEGNKTDVLKFGMELNLKIDYDDTDAEKKYLKIQFINEVGGVKNKLDKAGAVQAMQGMNFAGDILRHKQAMGITNEPAKQSTDEAPTFDADQEIPF